MRLNGVQEVVGSNPAGPRNDHAGEQIAMFHVYILQSAATGRRYVGSCENIEERVHRHNAGHSKSTRHGVPWILLRSESFSTRAEAVRKERYYKSGRGRDELDRLSR